MKTLKLSLLLFLALSIIYSCKKKEPEVVETIVYVHDCPDTTNASGDLAIGDFHEGGVIFYLDNTGEHGLVCSISDYGNVDWGCVGTAINGANDLSFGSGSQNTQDIIQMCGDIGSAAFYCDAHVYAGFSDWYLPSRDELLTLYEKRNDINATIVEHDGDQIANFYGEYWSSSQVSSSDAWAVNFEDGSPVVTIKYHHSNARPIRSF